MRSKTAELSQETKDFLASQQAKLVDYDIQLNYNYWTSGTRLLTA